MKKVVSFLLALVMCSTLCTTALASERKNEFLGISVGDKFEYGNIYHIMDLNSESEKEILLASKDYENGISDFILVEDGIIIARTILDRKENTLVCSNIIDGKLSYSSIDLPQHVLSQNTMLAADNYSPVGGITYRYYDQGYASGTRRIALSISESTNTRARYNLNGVYEDLTAFVGIIAAALTLPSIVAGELAKSVLAYLGFGVTFTNAVIPTWYVDATEYESKWKLTYLSTTAYLTGWKYTFYHVRNGRTENAYEGKYYSRSQYTSRSASFAEAVYRQMPIYWGGDGRVEVVSWG